jgi:type I restriction enzyme S subunit
MSNGRPQGWANPRLAEIAEINPRHPKGLDDSMPISFVRMAAVSESKPQFDSLEVRMLGEVRKGFTHFAEGDVVFAKITPCMENGKGAVATGLQNGIGCGTTELHVIRPLGGIDSHYVYRFLAQNSVRRSAKENFTGTAGQARVPTSFIKELELALAPLAEQRRIVAKLEKLLGQVDACQQRLVKLPALLKRFRQSVLAAACSGRLTADWREEYPTSPEWKTVELVELAENIQIGPFGTQLHKADYISNGVPLINPTHIQSSKIVHDPDFSVSQSKLKELGNYLLQTNDIIMGRRGEMARCALISKNENGWLCGTGSLFIRPKSNVSPDFLFLVLRSPETKAFLENEAQGTTMSNLNLEILRRVPVFISSLAGSRWPTS